VWEHRRGPLAIVSKCKHNALRFNKCQTRYLSMKTAVLSMRISPPVKKAMEKAAKDDQRSVAGMTEKILTDWLRGHGYLPKT